MNEEWRPVVGYEGRYDVSSEGRVRSLVFRNGTAEHRRSKPLIMSLKTKTNGYCRLTLTDRRTVAVHHLVLEAFHGPRPEGKEAAHLNGVRNDNRPSNLQWATSTENHSHKRWHGTLPEGEAVHNAKLTREAVRAIRRAVSRGACKAVLGRRFGVSRRAINFILSGETWAHVV